MTEKGLTNTAHDSSALTVEVRSDGVVMDQTVSTKSCDKMIFSFKYCSAVASAYRSSTQQW